MEPRLNAARDVSQRKATQRGAELQRFSFVYYTGAANSWTGLRNVVRVLLFVHKITEDYSLSELACDESCLRLQMS